MVSLDVGMLGGQHVVAVALEVGLVLHALLNSSQDELPVEGCRITCYNISLGSM